MSKKPEAPPEAKVLFPGDEVPLPDGSVIKVKPLTLANFSKVTSSMETIVSLVASGVDPGSLGVRAMAQLVDIIPYCIDRKADEVPASAIPDLLRIVVEQNISDEILKKWSALGGILDKLFPKRAPSPESANPSGS